MAWLFWNRVFCCREQSRPVSESEARKLLGRQGNSHFPDNRFGIGDSAFSLVKGARTTSHEGTLRSGPRAEGSTGLVTCDVTTRAGWRGGNGHQSSHRGSQVGHRTQCQGQNQPGRRNRKLLTRASRKKRGGLGSRGACGHGEVSKCAGVPPQRAAADRGPLNTLAGGPPLEARRGG